MQSPSKRRWFQFGLRGLLLGLVVLAVAIKLGDDYRVSSDIDGTWVGVGRHEGITMVFGRRVLTVKNLAGALDMPFQAYRADQSLRIHGSNGEQRGLYRVDGDTLELRIANSGRPAPQAAPSSVKEPGTMDYVLKRSGN